MATLPTINPSGPVKVSDNTLLAFTASTNNQVFGSGYPIGAYDPVDLTLVRSINLSNYGIALSSDGTKIYGSNGASSITQYNMSTAWDISTATSAHTLDVSAQESSLWTFQFSDDGTKLYFIGAFDEVIYQYDLSTAWSLSTATYASKSFDPIAQDSNPRHMCFGDSGSKMYVAGSTNDTIYQYTLSTPWDVSTASYASKSGLVSAATTLTMVQLSPDGTMVSVNCSDTSSIYRYLLTTAWDISTITSTPAKVPAIVTNSGFCFADSGTRLYLSTSSGAGQVNQYNVTTTSPWPSDLQKVDTLSWTVEYRETARSDDTLALDIRVMDGATVLAAADSGGSYVTVVSNPSNTTDVTAGPTAFAYVNTSATATQWKRGVVQLRQRLTVSMANDNCFVSVDYVALTGTYTSLVTPRPLLVKLVAVNRGSFY